MPCIGIGGSVTATGAVLSHRVVAGVLRDNDGLAAVRSDLAAAFCIDAMACIAQSSVAVSLFSDWRREAWVLAKALTSEPAFIA